MKFFERLFQFVVVAQVVAQFAGSVPADEHIGGDAVDLELFAEIFPLLVVEPVMFALNLTDLLLIGDQRRGFVGDVNPHEVVRFQFSAFERLVVFDRRLTGSAPGVPEIDQHDPALVGCDDGVEQLVGGHVGRLFDLHLAFQRRQLPAHLGLDGFARLGVERILQRTERGEVSLRESIVFRFGGQRTHFAQIGKRTGSLDELRPIDIGSKSCTLIFENTDAHRQFRVVDIEKLAEHRLIFGCQFGKFIVELRIAVPHIMLRPVIVFQKETTVGKCVEGLLLERKQRQFCHHAGHAAAGDTVG